MVSNQRELNTALSYESTVDEMVFVLGPALVGIAASAAVPVAPLVLAATLVLAAGVPFAMTATGKLDAAEEESGRPGIMRVL